MITLLHGDNTQASRLELNRLRLASRGKEVRQVDGRGLDATGLIQALESRSLFGGEIFVIIENLFGRLGRKTKLIEDLGKILASSADNTEIILWEDREIGVTVTKSLGSAQIKLFKFPVFIFQLLDGLRPNNGKALILLLQKLAPSETPELIFAMIVRRLRQLMMLRDNVVPDGLQSWQIGRLTSQANLFTMDELLVMHCKLLNIEYSIKSGIIPLSLSQQLELLFVDL